MCDCSSAESMQDLVRMYQRKENELLMTDRSFEIEGCFLTQCGPRLEAVVKDKVLSFMATGTVPKT